MASGTNAGYRGCKGLAWLLPIGLAACGGSDGAASNMGPVMCQPSGDTLDVFPRQGRIDFSLDSKDCAVRAGDDAADGLMPAFEVYDCGAFVSIHGFGGYQVVQISAGRFENGILASGEGAYVTFGFPLDEEFEVVIASPDGEQVAIRLTLVEGIEGVSIHGASVDFSGVGQPGAVTMPSEFPEGVCGAIF